jgi:hypothetical protein
MSWWRRNAVILLPAFLILAYVAVYLLAFPRYEWTRGTYFDTARYCSYDWEQSTWRPLAWVEQWFEAKVRRKRFYFLSFEHLSAREKDRPVYTGTRAWP